MLNKEIRDSIKLPEFDVIVAGAGLAGVAAAVAAADEGMKF